MLKDSDTLGGVSMDNATKESQTKMGFLRLTQVLELIPVGKSTWWDGVKQGRFPKGVKLSPRTTAWSVNSIQNLITELEEGDSGPKGQ